MKRTSFLLIFFTIFFIATGNNVSADSAKTELRWKIPRTNLYYLTNFDQQNDENYFEINIDKILTDKKFNGEVEDGLKKIKFPDQTNMVTIMENLPNQKIRTTSYFQNYSLPSFGEENPVDPKTREDLKKFTASMNKIPQIQSIIDSAGNILSFYLPQRQKNLVALMSELPQQPVSIGDTWEISVYCIELGSGFSMENADRVNMVRLQDVTTNSNGDRIAKLEYLITEKVSGQMQNPMTSEKTPTEMTCSYIGTHDFNINQGRWEQIRGELSINSKGLMNSKAKQSLAMKPIPSLPKGITHEQNVPDLK